MYTLCARHIARDLPPSRFAVLLAPTTVSARADAAADGVGASDAGGEWCGRRVERESIGTVLGSLAHCK
jgi:hypothetical protein